MALKVTPKPTFTVTVEIPPSGDDIEVTYRFKSADEFTAWRESSVSAGKVARNDVELLVEVIADIKGLEADDGKPVSYGAGTLAEWAVRYPALCLALFNAYHAALFGLPGARTKN